MRTLKKQSNAKVRIASHVSAGSRMEIAICREWLRRHAKPRKTMNRKLSSYKLKHWVEDWSEQENVVWLAEHPVSGRFGVTRVYVKSQSFSEAARLEGYRSEPTYKGSPDCYFNFAWI